MLAACHFYRLEFTFQFPKFLHSLDRAVRLGLGARLMTMTDDEVVHRSIVVATAVVAVAFIYCQL